MGNKTSNAAENSTKIEQEQNLNSKDVILEKKDSKDFNQKFSVNWLSQNGDIVKIKPIKSSSIPICSNESEQDDKSKEELLKIKRSADVVIIGAGPVGLWISILIKLKRPSLNIILYERHKEYIRSNNIKMPKGEKYQVPNLPEIKGLLEKKIVPIQEIEKILKTEAEKFKIEIINEQINSITDLTEHHQNAKLIIGADGAHSQTRLSTFGQSPIVTNLFNLVQVSYKTKDKAKDMPALKKYAVLKKVDLFVEDTQIENQVNLRFFVPNETFDAVKHYTVKEPCLDLAQVPDQYLLYKIQFWIKARKYYIGEEQVLSNSLKMTTFRLDCYRSPEFGKLLRLKGNGDQGREVPFVLCGDACFGVPFYRSLRNGWITASNLADLFVGNLNNPSAFLDKYSNFVEKLYEKEISRAKSKYQQVNLVQTFCHISSLVPWQVVFISNNKEKIINDVIIDYI